ncbi:hypothetical protein F5Y16DRAFT_43428 [Xylariaceae sp. FL0255]|nr:hypothetical protein F5Y16DRAFT_43428 [Xylariaceae sp. FL0255]
MFENLITAARDLSVTGSALEIPASLSDAAPDELSIIDIKQLLVATQGVESAATTLWAVYAVLKTARVTQGDEAEVETRDALKDILSRIGELMEPVCTGASFDEDSTDYKTLSHNGLLGLKSLDLLTKVPSTETSLFPNKTLLSIIAYTNPADKWTTPTSAELARSLLAQHFHLSFSSPEASDPPPGGLDIQKKKTQTHPTQKSHFITEDILTSFLRPLFAKSRPTAVTASGRPAAFPEPAPRYSQGGGFGGIGASDDVTSAKPWKYSRQYAVTVFEWAVENADTSLLTQHWPLFTPILLTLLDEPQPTDFKLRSLSIFRDFWSRCPTGLLARTGLAEVFEQAIFPTVLSLPSLTPPAESLVLLNAAYPALFDVAGIKHSSNAPAQDQGGDTVDSRDKVDDRAAKQFSNSQRKLQDKIVREGIMTGYHHAKEHVRLADLFCRLFRHLVDGIGILSVKYLKDIILIISEVLTDPFGTNYPAALLSATYLLQAILRNCWPRMSHYSSEVIRVVMVCWLHIQDEGISSTTEGQPTGAELETELRKIIEMLSAITKVAEIDMAERVEPLIAKEPSLRALLEP